ncbi:cysteine dioxygenase type 1-like [Oppia nitens]|uniref:cysteine dioxygenase type 1-like n=1 Tax=Oppia nitens TaxID=1686743 RepID=UPI0023DC598D|nr:cysteine dioxygenase type 1-like [Oppia nitens]
MDINCAIDCNYNTITTTTTNTPIYANNSCYNNNNKSDIVSKVETFDDLVKALREVFTVDTVDVDYVHNLLMSYKSNPQEWRKYAHFDKNRYTRNLVDKGNGKYNLMLLCWSEGQSSSIHDHSDSHCFMKMLSGSLHEIRYEWPENTTNDSDTTTTSSNNNTIVMNNNSGDDSYEMKVLEENILKTNGVAYINDSIGLHRVENRSHTGPAVSMHLYIPPYSKCQTFDERTGSRNISRVTFYSKYGARTPYRVTNCLVDKTANQ